MSAKHDFRHYPEWLHHELLNWARWCWLGPYPHPLPPGHCYSIEHQYVGHHLEEEDESEPPTVKQLLFTDRAMKVDAVWRQMVGAPRIVLRAEYPLRYESGRVEFGQKGAARGLHMPLHEYRRALGVAIDLVWEAM